RKPVGSYVDPDSAEWLQTRRVELNAMTTPQFIAWLDEKMKRYGQGKLIPKIPVAVKHLARSARGCLKKSIRERILAEAGFKEQVQEAYEAMLPTIRQQAGKLQGLIRDKLATEPEQSWRAPLDRRAEELVGDTT